MPVCVLLPLKVNKGRIFDKLAFVILGAGELNVV